MFVFSNEFAMDAYECFVLLYIVNTLLIGWLQWQNESVHIYLLL